MTAPESVPPAAVPGWATNIPGRRPEFKTHNTVGQAKNAVLNSYRYSHRAGFAEDMVIYKLADDGQYRPWLEIFRGSDRNDYKELAVKPPSASEKLGELSRLRRSLKYHNDEAERLVKEIGALRLELGEL